MSSELEDAVEELFDEVFADQDVDTCVYMRGSQGQGKVRAIKGFRGTELRQPDGAYLTIMDDDFIVWWKDLRGMFGDEPEIHDRIFWREREFEVGVDGVERHYDAMDPWLKMLRVHTTEVSRD